MKYNNLSILLVLVFSLFTFFFPINVSAQEITSQSTITVSAKESSSPLKIEDYVNKYLEIKLVNGKKVKGKLVEYKDENLVLKDGLIKKQISMANVVSFETVESPGEKFKKGMEDAGVIALTIIAVPVIGPIELILHANGDCLENHGR
jgi:small nuclear ribonucleoprotein (snRNP)-like protein